VIASVECRHVRNRRRWCDEGGCRLSMSTSPTPHLSDDASLFWRVARRKPAGGVVPNVDAPAKGSSRDTVKCECRSRRLISKDERSFTINWQSALHRLIGETDQSAPVEPVAAHGRRTGRRSTA
jgi:hypothetical protein